MSKHVNQQKVIQADSYAASSRLGAQMQKSSRHVAYLWIRLASLVGCHPYTAMHVCTLRAGDMCRRAQSFGPWLRVATDRLSQDAGNPPYTPYSWSLQRSGDSATARRCVGEKLGVDACWKGWDSWFVQQIAKEFLQ